MSWIGGLNDSFTQLTSKAGQIGGQLSSFTKEVLTETTDEDIGKNLHAMKFVKKFTVGLIAFLDESI